MILLNSPFRKRFLFQVALLFIFIFKGPWNTLKNTWQQYGTEGLKEGPRYADGRQMKKPHTETAA